MATHTERGVQRTCKWLAGRLRGEYRRAMQDLGRVPASVPELRSAGQALEAPGRAGPEPAAAQALLREASARVAAALQAQPWEGDAQRGLLLRVLDLLRAAGRRIALLAPPRPADGAGRLVVPGDLLYQAHHALFPAERMLVAGGRRRGGTTALGALFDVTGAGSPGHVRADPTRLGRALIAMDLSETYLAAWLHSHPGLGGEATHPSRIDRQQFQDWIRDYTPRLVGAILSADGWVRFWGSAVEEGRVAVQVTGSGVRLEDKDGTLYRLEG